MKINKLSSRHVIFTHELDEWNLHLHLIIGKHRNYLIDTGLGTESVAFIVEYIKLQGLTKELVIINTHYHWDHIWGNHLFPDSLIIAHTICYQLLVEKWDEMQLLYAEKYARGVVRKMLPNMTFTDQLTFPDDSITLFYSPGHTIDGISVYDHIEGVLNIGDNIGDTLKDLLPELETPPAVFAETLTKYLQIEGLTKCVCGHNEVVTPDIIQSLYDIVITL